MTHMLSTVPDGRILKGKCTHALQEFNSRENIEMGGNVSTVIMDTAANLHYLKMIV